MLAAAGHLVSHVDHAYHPAEPVLASVRVIRTELAVGYMLAGFAKALVLIHSGREFHGGQELTAGPLKSASASAAQAWAQSLSASMVAASTPGSTFNSRG